VFDASAILALAVGEPGFDMVRPARPDAVVSAVNHLEVVSKLLQTGLDEAEVRHFLDEAFPRVVPLDRSQADGAAKLHARSRELRLSYADCACLALAEARGFPVLTGDRKWTRIDLPVEVRLFR
jgi:PIN domain nuclease of toxin-antitoxin system